MFLWLRVLGIEDSEIVVKKARERGLLTVFGRPFMPSNEKSPHIRLSYSAVSEEECDKVGKEEDSHYVLVCFDGYVLDWLDWLDWLAG